MGLLDCEMQILSYGSLMGGFKICLVIGHSCTWNTFFLNLRRLVMIDFFFRVKECLCHSSVSIMTYYHIDFSLYFESCGDMFWRSFCKIYSKRRAAITMHVKSPKQSTRHYSLWSCFRIGKLLRLLVSSADGYLYIYNVDPEEGGDCTLLKQHRYQMLSTWKQRATIQTRSAAMLSLEYMYANRVHYCLVHVSTCFFIS